MSEQTHGYTDKQVNIIFILRTWKQLTFTEVTNPFHPEMQNFVDILGKPNSELHITKLNF